MKLHVNSNDPTLQEYHRDDSDFWCPHCWREDEDEDDRKKNAEGCLTCGGIGHWSDIADVDRWVLYGQAKLEDLELALHNIRRLDAYLDLAQQREAERLNDGQGIPR